MVHLSVSLTRLQSFRSEKNIRNEYLRNESNFQQGKIGRLDPTDCTVGQRTSLGSLSQASPSCATSSIPSLLLASSCPCSRQGCGRLHDRSSSSERRSAVDLHSKRSLIPWNHTNALIDCSFLKLFVVFSTGRTGLVSNTQDPRTGPPITVRKGVNNDSQYA